VLIGFLKGNSNNKTNLFKEVLQRNIPYGFSALTLQEVLQGALNEKEFKTLKEYLSSQRIYYLKQEYETYEKAARIFFETRRKGFTPRSTIDVLIVLTAIDNNLLLLHDDRDFDIMAMNLAKLNILETI
jgi:predicted nucleic acid-binding protein